ncbi:MAG: hypothetical protein ABI863_23455 [Ginsengibacter sp.]
MKSSYRNSGNSAIASGVIGFLAFGFLITVLIMHPDNFILMIRFHDGGVIFQFLLMIPFVFALHKLSQKCSPNMNKTTLVTGITMICLVILFLLLIFPKIVADTLYMCPQGIFGVWLIGVNRQLSGLFPSGLRWFGMIVGSGLVLVGIFPVGYSIFVDTILLRIPARIN